MDTKSVPVPKLAAKKITFKIYLTWRAQLVSLAQIKGWGPGLKANQHLPATCIDWTQVVNTDAAAKKQTETALKSNAAAMAYLTHMLVNERAISCIEMAKTPEYPDGLAHLLLDRLDKKFMPKGGFKMSGLRDQLRSIRFKAKDDPNDFFEKIAGIKNLSTQLGQTDSISKDELVSHVITTIPEKYMSCVKKVIDEKSDAITVEDLESEIIEWYELRNSSISECDWPDSDEDEEETALSGITFNGKCYNCGKDGHRANNCKEKKKERTNYQSGGGGGRARFTGKCRKCDKVGHKEPECWELEKNANKRPKGYKTAAMRETGMAAADDDDDVEYLLCSVVKDHKEFSSKEKFQISNPNIVIADTGASVNVSKNSEGMTNTRAASAGVSVVMGDGKAHSPDKVGDVSVTQYRRNGEAGKKLLWKDVHVSEQFEYNLLSVTKYMKEGWKLTGSATEMTLTKGEIVLTFDILIKTGQGTLYCAYFKRNPVDTAAVAAGKPKDTAAKKPKETAAKSSVKTNSIAIRAAHCKYGHLGEAECRKTAKALGYRVLRGVLKACEACAVANAQQKSVPKLSVSNKSTAPNGRIFLDLSKIKAPKDLDITVTKSNWRLMVCEYTGLKFSDFFETKDGMVEPTCVKMNQWKQQGKPVKIVRMDNAGENLKLAKQANGKNWKLNLEIEYTGKATPQRNHLVELGFATLWARARATMIEAKVPLAIRYKVCKECIATVTLLDGLVTTELNGQLKTRFEHWYGKIPRFAKKLRTWGEAGVVKTKILATPKVGDRGVTCMFVGYNTDHGDDVYRMWNPITNRLLRSRDIRWLGRYYFDEPKSNPSAKVGENVSVNSREIDDSEDEKSEDEVEQSDDSDHDDSDTDKEDEPEIEKVEEATRTRSGRASREPIRLIEETSAVVGFTRQEAVGKLQLSNLESNYYAALMNLSCTETDETEMEEVDKVHLQEYACVGAGIGGGFQNTKELHVMKFKEAMNTPDRKQWEGAVEKEHDNMMKYSVWTPVKLQDLPEGTKVLTSTWAMKKKANGTHRARVVARGFEQIEGVHYDGASIAAPVTNDMSIRIIMVLALMAGWASKIVDVKGAFLRGEFEDGAEPVYLKVPEGFEQFYPKNVVLMLLKTIYGLCEAAMAFWKEMLKAFKAMQFERSTADPCMYYKWTTAGFLIVWLSWIDDCACFGMNDDVEESRKEMNQLFECDDIGDMNEYVGCKIDKSEGSIGSFEPEGGIGSIKFTQPVMLQSFKDEFDLENQRETITPAEPGSTLPKVPEDANLNDREQTYFRSGVGKLLHMMRWSRPEVYNAVRDLSRHMKASTTTHVKAMHRVMKYCVSTPHRGWTLKPNRKWNGRKGFLFRIRGKSDSDYATCPITRKSVSGYAVFLEGAPITVKSLMQRIIALSVTEAETISGVACVQEMLYAMKILLSLGLLVELPMILEIDNKGAVDMANNWSVGGRTKHMDVRYLWLRELKEQGLVRVIWTSGESNDADLFTKNLPGPAFKYDLFYIF